MADNGLGIGMLVMGVGEIGALLHKQSESALAKPILIAVDQICPQSVDGDL